MAIDIAALSGLLSGVGNAANAVGGVVFNALNYHQQKEQYNYMKQMQQQAWLREDNAAQRRVADLKAAGLSPVLAAGSAASSSSPIQVTAPQYQGFNIPNLADAVNTAVGVKQAIVQMRKTIADEQKTLAETVGTNLNNQILEVAKENAQVKFDLQKAQTAEIGRRLGLIDAQTAQATQDRLFKKIQTDIYTRDYGIYNRSYIDIPMAYGNSGTLTDVMRSGVIMADGLQDVATAAVEKFKSLFGGKKK